MQIKRLFYGICLLALSAGWASCDDADSDAARAAGFAGYYRIVSIRSDDPVDVNNDGQESNDLYREFNSPYYLNGKAEPDFHYYFDQYGSYAEVRPMADQPKNVQLIEPRVPGQLVVDDMESDSKPFLITYNADLAAYLYTFTDTDEVLLEAAGGQTPRSPEFDRLHRVGNKGFVLEGKATFFNFKTSRWIETKVKIDYLKVEETNKAPVTP